MTERIDQLIRRYADTHPLMGDRRYPGYALAVLIDGEVAFRAFDGAANVERGAPIGGDTQFRIASLTKQMTCAVILMLEREGRLSLDDRLGEYFPKLRFQADAITLRQLCWNTAGIRDYFALATLSGMTKYGGLGREKIDQFVYGQVGLNFPPGSQERYSNTNYVLLTRIAEKVSGRAFGELLKTYLFDPLGMTRSLHMPWAPADSDVFATGYQLDKSQALERTDIDSELSGEGGICSTLDDLVLWERALDDGIPGAPGLTRALNHRVDGDGRDTSGYGFGLQIGTYRGLRLEQHGGYIPGYRSQRLRFPEARVSVIVLSNGPIDAGRMALDVADICLDEKGAKSSDAPAPVRATPQHRRFLGFYPDPALFMGYSLKESGGELKLRVFGLDKPLYQLDDKRIGDSIQSSFPFVFEFDPNVDGVIKVSTCASAPRRIERSDGRADAKDVSGDYYSDELKTHYRIRRSVDQISVEIESDILACGSSTYALVALAPGIYRIDGELLDEVLLFFSGDAAEFRATVIRAEGVLFRRVGP